MSHRINEPWISVIGIGEAGISDLSDLSLSLIKDADHLIGGARHLEMVPDDIAGKAKHMVWPSPFSDAFAKIEALRGSQVVVLATGDPMYCGIGGTLSRHFSLDDLRIVPSVGAFSLAASRLGWALDQVIPLTIHGADPERDVASLRPYVMPGARLLILSRDGNSPALVAQELCAVGAQDAAITILEHLGGDKEHVIEMRADALLEDSDRAFADLNTLAVEIPAHFTSWFSTQAGLPDEAYQHDGKITKRDIRASALAKLAPRPNALLWDVGTGCGSIAIEWLRSNASCRAIGFEPLEKRRIMASHNARMLGVPRLKLIDGMAPDALDGKDLPDAIFIGGGVSEAVIDACLNALKPNGRLVVHAVTLSSEACLLEAFSRHGGELTRLSIAKAEPVGPYFGWKSAMPVTQWAYIKAAKTIEAKTIEKDGHQ